MNVRGVRGVCGVLCMVETRAAIGLCGVCGGFGLYARAPTRTSIRRQHPLHAGTRARVPTPAHPAHPAQRRRGAGFACAGYACHPAHPAQTRSRTRAGAFPLSRLSRERGRGGRK